MTSLDRLAKCPEWPAVLSIDAAVLYLGGREARLLGLIVRGYLTPWHHGHKDTDFLRSEIDTALKVARMNEDALEVPDEVRTVGAALEAAKAIKPKKGRAA
jgi:hypothetical protein